MKKIIAIVLVLVMAMSLAACGGAADDGKINATFVGVMQGGTAWGAAEQGFMDACEELGWEGQYVAPSTPNDTTVMVELTETALTNGADVLIGTYYSADIFGDVLQPAFQNGTYVVSTNCFMGPDYQNFWIGTDPDGMGISQAKTLVALAGDQEVCVVYMQTNATSETQNDQFKAFCEYLKDYPNITVFGQEYCDSNEIVAAEKIANLVKANPQINACVAADGNGCIGLANYVDENGVNDEFIAVGIDDDATILGYVTNTALDCTIAQDFYTMGYQSCMMIKNLMDGGSEEFHNDSGTVVIMPEDVEGYAAEKGIELNAA